MPDNEEFLQEQLIRLEEAAARLKTNSEAERPPAKDVPDDNEAVRRRMNEETMRSRKRPRLKDNPMAHETARRYDEMTNAPHDEKFIRMDDVDWPAKGTANALYNVDTEAALLARDLARLRPRLRLLARNLDRPWHVTYATAALKYLDLALQEVASI